TPRWHSTPCTLRSRFVADTRAAPMIGACQPLSGHALMRIWPERSIRNGSQRQAISTTMSKMVDGAAAVEALVERARHGDREALAGLYDRCRDRVGRFATGRLGNAEKAEDVTSETFEAMLRSLRSYQPGTDFEAWLFTIAHRRVSDHFRRLGRRREV